MKRPRIKQFEARIDENGERYLATTLSGYHLTRMPLLNKGSSFTPRERRELGLAGLLAPHVSTLEEEVERGYANFTGFTTNLDKHVYLRVLQDRNETLFYALLEEHLEEMLPIIYTPTVAEAVQKFSLIYRWPRGLVVSTDNIDYIEEAIAEMPVDDVRLGVVTDSEGILGIGDQGFGGMAICIGKLSLYTAGAGINPARTLPIELDVGTNRQDLLDDPLYLGVRHERLTGDEYNDFVERFVRAFRKQYPGALLQWEDFSRQKAFDVLDRYRDELPSFNDDIQGTGAVVLAGLLASSRMTRRRLTDETFVVHGGGAGGVGVATQIVNGLIKQGLTAREARDRVFVLDEHGLLVEGRANVRGYQEGLVQRRERLEGWDVSGDAPTLYETVRNSGATALLGLSGQAGAFDREIVGTLAANSLRPIVFPLSNPTANSEAVPADILDWTDGAAVISTGSPFPDVPYKEKHHVVAQGNNAFIFPGLGLGALVTGASRVTDGMLTVAAEALASYTDPGRLLEGAVYPKMATLRRVSRHVAGAVATQAVSDGVATRAVPEDVMEAIDAYMWEPRYLPIRKV